MKLYIVCKIFSACCYWCIMEVICPGIWLPSSRWILGPLVWPLPYDPPYYWWFGKTICREAKMLQSKHRREPFNCNTIWDSKHPNRHYFQGWWEERCNYWCCSKIHFDHQHREILVEVVRTNSLKSRHVFYLFLLYSRFLCFNSNP